MIMLMPVRILKPDFQVVVPHLKAMHYLQLLKAIWINGSMIFMILTHFMQNTQNGENYRKLKESICH